MADSKPPPGLRGKIAVRVDETVTLENLHGIVSGIVGMTGCRTCGIAGIDLLLSGDPPEAQQFANLPGVRSVGFGE